MVSNAKEDLPEPDRPVNTTNWSRGMATSIFLRLCSRAPRIAITRASPGLGLDLSFMEPWARARSSGSNNQERSENRGLSPVPATQPFVRGDNQKAKGRRKAGPSQYLQGVARFRSGSSRRREPGWPYR